ncbi:hypothetical protein N0V84_007294 [Fusarium piperis]|uniref:VOC domain-containing protein n=1 Tax=Fusarium piperis TaxID=1435070 RepID=A0A9W8WA95_9HYPO|nr:hypothetical protein N0V84_007294 [Fusarium piperis]
MIRISDPKKSLDFYTGLLRMSFLFSMNAGPFTIYFLGHPDRADQSAADIMKDGTRTGLLELIHLTTTADDTVGAEWGNAGAPQTLGHLGFRVPDVNALLERAQLGGHKVLKTVPHIPSTAVGIHEGVGVQGLHPSFLQGYSQIGFIADPDGSLTPDQSLR